LRERLSEEWPGDRNVKERIAYDYPPTFQPGYVGPSYFSSGGSIILMGQNPGEGSDPVSVEMNREYRAGLEAFTQRDLRFEDLNRLVALHMLRWSVFKGKGIFRESGAGRMSPLDEDVRPSIEDVGYVNHFPFKTSANRSPFKMSSLRGHVWTGYVARLLELLAPTVIVLMGAWGRSVDAQLRGSAGSPKVMTVWHPSDYNLNTRPRELQASWKSLSAYLQSLARR
jgi:hypothetical protein